LSSSSVTILGVRIDSLPAKDLMRRVAEYAVLGEHHQVMYANVHVLNTAYRDPALRRVLNRADVVYCDGSGVRVGARILGQYLPERMTGADWIHDLCDICQERGLSLYFLGGEPGIAAQAARKLETQYPGLRITGTHHGHYDHDGSENEDILATINALPPDILLVGFGTPLQEKWIARNARRLNTPVVWAVGALVDFVAGKTPRGPRWMLEHGLEWLYRLWVEPKRLWRRYVLGNPLFVLRALKERVLKTRVR
jgi:N-acetylglucosaminyldiphosphoundecaprenol N-acetyl-beta-D-mannosaminyltransferase